MFDKKILCLGNNDEDTDTRTSQLAEQNNTINHGLFADSLFVPTNFGFYHTSILDLSFGEIIDVAKYFDQIIFFDQPVAQWSHWKPMLSSYKVMLQLDSMGYNTLYKDNVNIEKYTMFYSMLEQNKSFCIYPWINIVEENGDLNLCARSRKKVTTIKQLKNWQTDPEFTSIRQKMLAGETLPDHCAYCYNLERQGVESYRQFETKEWISKLDITSVDDLNHIDKPYYYEVRLSNKCNLQCRGCNPAYSHLIGEEFIKHNIVHPAPWKFNSYRYSDLGMVDIDKLDSRTRVYLTGGEPSIMAEVLQFMKTCIDNNRVDFDFTLGTNAFKFSAKFFELCSHFTNMNFSVSIDGVGKVNDYWRWGSDWETIISNIRRLQDQGHTVSINCVPGIYNVANLHLLYEFLDREFPQVGIYLQINQIAFMSPYNHPNVDLVIESMRRCQQTKTYYTDGKSNRTTIDSLLAYYVNNPVVDLQNLKLFFEYNDQLDRARNVHLGDYIPELEACRKLIDQ